MKWIIHVGLPKAGSTSLQAAFHELGGVYYVGKWKPDVRPSSLVPAFEFKMDSDKSLIQDVLDGLSTARPRLGPVKRWIEDVEARARSAKCETVLVSDEKLSGLLGLGDWAGDVTDIVRPLLRLLGDRLTLVVMARAPFSWLKSYYAMRVRAGMSASFEEFVVWCCAFSDTGPLRAMAYSDLCYQVDRSQSRLALWVFEAFVSDPDYRAKCFESLGLSRGPIALDHQNSGVDAVRLEAMRVWNEQNGHRFIQATGPSRRPKAQLWALFEARARALGLDETHAQAREDASMEAFLERKAAIQEAVRQNGPAADLSLTPRTRRVLNKVMAGHIEVLRDRSGVALTELGYEGLKPTE